MASSGLEWRMQPSSPGSLFIQGFAGSVMHQCSENCQSWSCGETRSLKKPNNLSISSYLPSGHALGWFILKWGLLDLKFSVLGLSRKKGGHFRPLHYAVGCDCQTDHAPLATKRVILLLQAVSTQSHKMRVVQVWREANPRHHLLLAHHWRGTDATGAPLASGMRGGGTSSAPTPGPGRTSAAAARPGAQRRSLRCFWTLNQNHRLARGRAADGAQNQLHEHLL